MKNYFKKILTVCLIASLSVAAFGCSSKNNSSEAELPRETISLDQTKVPLTFEHETGAGIDVTEGGEKAEDTNTDASSAESAAVGEETKPKAETSVFAVPVTEIVKVTEAGGGDAAGIHGLYKAPGAFGRKTENRRGA